MSQLVAQDLNLQIDQNLILDRINLSVTAGQVLGILGPNGAGKTSLLKMLSGQTNSQSQVTWKQRPLNQYSSSELAKQIAVVNQMHDSVFALNLYQIVQMGLLPHKTLLSRHTAEDDKAISLAIDRVGLSAKSQQTFSSLSGGEQQRGLIARALVQQASLIILDEPVNHLDVYYQHQILTLLAGLAHQFDITVVMSLHDLNLAAEYCDQICLLNQGRVESMGAPIDVLKAPDLERVFGMPCKVSEIHSPDTRYHHSPLQVSFYPPFRPKPPKANA